MTRHIRHFRHPRHPRLRHRHRLHPPLHPVCNTSTVIGSMSVAVAVAVAAVDLYLSKLRTIDPIPAHRLTCTGRLVSQGGQRGVYIYIFEMGGEARGW